MFRISYIFPSNVVVGKLIFSSNFVAGNHWVHELKNAIWAAYDMNSLPNSTQHQPKVNPFSIIHEQFKDGKVHRYSDRKKRSMGNADKVRLSYLYSSKCECSIKNKLSSHQNPIVSFSGLENPRT